MPISLPRSITRIFEKSEGGRHQQPFSLTRIQRKRHEDFMRQVNQIVVKGLNDRIGYTIIPNQFIIKLGRLDYSNLFLEVKGLGCVSLTLTHDASMSQTLVYFTYKIKPMESTPIEGFPSKAIIAHGRGLKIIKKGAISTFKVNTSKIKKSGAGPLEVSLLCPDGSTLSPFQYIPHRHGCKVDFICEMEGLHSISVKWDDNHIHGSPFQVQCVERAFSYPDIPELLSGVTSFQIHFQKSDEEVCKKIGIVAIEED